LQAGAAKADLQEEELVASEIGPLAILMHCSYDSKNVLPARLKLRFRDQAFLEQRLQFEDLVESFLLPHQIVCLLPRPPVVLLHRRQWRHHPRRRSLY